MSIKQYTHLFTLTLSLISPFTLHSAQASTQEPESRQEVYIKQLKAMIARNNPGQLTSALKYEEFQNAFATFINKQDENGQTLLHKEAPKKEIDLAELFITHGAAINIQDNDGNTPLHCAVKDENESFIQLLIKVGACLNIKDKNDSAPLHYAVKYLKADLAKLLIDNSAHIDIQNAAGNTPLHYAVKNLRTDLVQFLIDHGARIDAQNNSGDTPLHDAAKVDDTNIIKLLVKAGANKELKNKSGQTPLQITTDIYEARKINQAFKIYDATMPEEKTRIRAKERRIREIATGIPATEQQELIVSLLDNLSATTEALSLTRP